VLEPAKTFHALERVDTVIGDLILQSSEFCPHIAFMDFDSHNKERFISRKELTSFHLLRRIN
jgi:hypothetical protein